MAFDNHCKIIGYEAALPLIKEWLNSDCANVRRAVSEWLRVWTSRPYFKDNPQIAIQLLSSHREYKSEYVRKSVGNALRDISKKNPELISAELNSWNLSSKEISLFGKVFLMHKFWNIWCFSLFGWYFCQNAFNGKRYCNNTTYHRIIVYSKYQRQ